MSFIILILFLSGVALASEQNTSSCGNVKQIQTGSRTGTAKYNVTTLTGQPSLRTPGAPFEAIVQIQIGNLSGSGVIELMTTNSTDLWLGFEPAIFPTLSTPLPQQTENVDLECTTTAPLNSAMTVRFDNGTLAFSSTGGPLASRFFSPTPPSLLTSGGVLSRAMDPLTVLVPALMQLAVIYLM